MQNIIYNNVYSQGGDEFAMIIKTRGFEGGYAKKLKPFYTSLKSEINNISLDKIRAKYGNISKTETDTKLIKGKNTLRICDPWKNGQIFDADSLQMWNL